MTDHTLLPCPFCGGEGAITPHVHHRALQACVCDECSSSSGWYLHEEEAIAAWNRRTSMPPIWSATPGEAKEAIADDPGGIIFVEPSTPPAVPDGWVMVPRDPTPEMLFAATSPESYWIGHPEAPPESIERWRQCHREDAARKYRSMISAAPAAPNGWRPIDTAPRDGTDVLLWDGEEIFVGYWSDSIWVSPGAWVKEEHRSDTVTYIPTHWMPLPAAPTEARDE